MRPPGDIDAVRLTSNRFLSGLSIGLSAPLVACAGEIRFSPGEFLGREGHDADRFFVVEEGRVGIELHGPGRGPVIVTTVGAGQLVGWSWLFPPHTWHFDAVALDTTLAISFDAAAIRRAFHHDVELRHELTERVAHTMARRLEAARIQLLDLYGGTP